MRDRLIELLKDSPMLDILYAEDEEWGLLPIIFVTAE